MFSITIFLLPSTRSFFTSHITAHDQDFQILQGASLPLPNSYINLSKYKTKYYTWHLTCDTWWLVTQLPCSNGMQFMMSWRLGGKGWLAEWMNQSINQSISYKAVCRTATAARGLLIIQIITLFTPASASTDLTAISTAFWPTPVAGLLK